MLRGIALVVMSLQHISGMSGRNFGAETFNGQIDVAMPWPYWLSGLITHFAAPTFWVLGGVSIALFAHARQKAGDTSWAITRFLLIRAGMIALMDLTLGSLLWSDRLGNTHVLLSISICIAVLSVARLLPSRVLIVLAVAMLLGYQALLVWLMPHLARPYTFWVGLWLTNYEASFLSIEFPVLGWMGVILLGLLAGRLLLRPANQRPRVWAWVAVGLFALWLVIRITQGFGDITHYTSDQPWYYFFIMSKSPPSLSYQAFFLGWTALLLAGLFAAGDKLNARPVRWLASVGQVSLFYFIVHPIVYRGLLWIDHHLPLGLSHFAQVYGLWLIGLAIMLPLSLGYRHIRKIHRDSLLKYL